MLTKLPLLIVPIVIASVAAIAMAAPKPVPPQRPQAVPFAPPLQASQPRPGKTWSAMPKTWSAMPKTWSAMPKTWSAMPKTWSAMPNMTQMPNSHIIAAFAVTESNKGLFMDTSGKMIGQSELAKPSNIIWYDGPPALAAPKPKH